MYAKYLLFLLPIFLLGLVSQANAISKDNSYQQIILPNGTTSNYNLSQNSTAIKLETQEGSYIFTNQCVLYKYPKGLIGNQSPEFTDSYQALASNTANGTSGWNAVGVINNAACSIYSVSNNTSVWITGTKTVTGAGTFSVTYFKAPQHDLKITISATNNNPAWTNYHLGLRELLQGIQRNVTLGSTVYDLSQHNNTGLNRAFISANNAQLIQLDKRTSFTMGLGWNNVNSVTDIYHNNNPTLQIDYTYNTPILSPGNTITIDPSITKDTASLITSQAAGGSVTGSFTIANNSHKILVVDVGMNRAAGVGTISSVTFDGVSMSVVPGTAVASTTNRHAFYYLLDSSLSGHTGTKTVTATFSGSQDASSIAAWSLYNVDQVTGIQNGNKTNASTGDLYVDVTGSKTNSWILQGLSAPGTNTLSFSDVQDWSDGSVDIVRGQHRASATVGKNYLAVGTANQDFVTSGAEILSFENVPATPTITKVNTLNSTAINATFTKPTGTTWSWLNFTLSGGATTHINTTNTFVLLHNYTQGSKYTFSLIAANSTGKSSSSITKYNYTTNIAPTSPAISNILSTGARITVTNPSGNFSGYLIYQVQGSGSNYTLAGTSSNTTNHFDITGLSGNTKHTTKLSTRYAVGTNYTGTSTNSTTVTFYTVPGTPTGLTITQTRALLAHLVWAPAIDNGTISGTKIERSNNNGATWTVINANTGNTTSAYNDTVPNAGTFTYRVSTIKYGGTSLPSGTASRSIWNYFTVNAYQADGLTPVYGQAIQYNSTSSNNRFSLISGHAIIPGISQLNNFTIFNLLINFVVGKSYNYNATTNHNINMTTNDYTVDCPFTGTGPDVEVWTNGTNGHRISTFTTPTCFANSTIKWTTKFTANGNDINSYNTTVYVKVINATYGTVAPLKENQTKVTTVFTSPYIISNGVIVGTGLQTEVFNWSMNLTIAPGFIPVNFTVGHISVSGVNPITAPIKFTNSIVNASATSVAVTFPSTYTMAYQLTFGNEGKTETLTGLPVTSPSLGISQTVLTFKNPGNDFVTIKAYDVLSNTTASDILAQPNSNVPFVTQFKNFKNGLFGTSAMIGGINIIDLIVLIVAMIGLNRANEIVGAFMMVIIVGVAGFFQIVTFPTAMISAIALAVLITVVTMKKYQNS